MTVQPLEAAWTLRALPQQPQVPAPIRDRTFTASVPSCVHTVLLRHNAIADPNLADNELHQHWIGETDWEYRCTFDADPALFDHERVEVCCDGLDTIATVRLNGTEIGWGENMHLAYRFDARPALERGRNELSIVLHSPMAYARKWEKQLGPLPRSNGDGGPFNFIRKMACNFGWDWGPSVVTSGVWKGVRLEAWNLNRIVAIRPRVIDSGWGDGGPGPVGLTEGATNGTSPPSSPRRIRLVVDVALATNHRRQEFVANLTVPGCSQPLSPARSEIIPRGHRYEFEIDNPALWWPTGHGAQALYEFRCQVRSPEHRPYVLHHASARIGLRTTRLDTNPDDIGREFVVRVNGKPIFCKGFNWIPDDCFLDRGTARERYRTRIQQALDCGCNMLRVWGGGIYETDDFYDLCDEMGMMVWQDFAFACATYPEEEPFQSLVEQEARQNISRLAAHPSLVLWNGCNENLIAYLGWGDPVWRKQVAGRTWGYGYYFDLLPRLMAELDPSRPFWNASPYSGDPDLERGVDPNSPDHGNMHLWEVWHGKGDYTNYRNFIPRFCSEFGYQAPANWSTLAESLGEANLVRGHPLLDLHQKSNGGNARNERLLSKDFDLAGLNYADLHYLLQVNQARALTTGVEWFRAMSPRCMGSLIWQFNDCYPVTSWSAIDSAGRRKPLWYAARRFHADRLLTIQPTASGLAVHVINDTDESWVGDCFAFAWDFTSPAPRPEPSHRVAFTAPPRGQRVIPLPAALQRSTDPTTACLVAVVGDRRALWFDAADRTIRYPAPRLDARLDTEGSHHRLTIRAESFLRDLVFNVDRLDPGATIDEQLLTLFPGEARALKIESARRLSVHELLSPPVMQCVNRFGAR